MNFKEQYRKRKHFFLYAIFGVLTTLVNYIVYFGIFAVFGSIGTTIPNIVAWIAAVVFAYFTNRRWVFASKVTGAGARVTEFIKFSGSRFFSLAVETGLLYLLVDVLRCSNLIVKLLLSVFIVIMNYLLSRLWVFKHE